MAVDRKTPTPSNYGATIPGNTFADAVNEEVAALWNRVPCTLTASSGTNTIVATCSPTLTAYAAGQSFWIVPFGANTGATTLNVDSLGAKTVKTAAGAALSGGELLTTTRYLLYYDGTDFRIIGSASTSSTAVTKSIFAHTQSNGVDGGSATGSAWTKYTLNTTHENSISGASIASSVVTLPSGTYYVQAHVFFHKVNVARLRLRNTTDGSTITLIGSATRADDTSASSGTATLRGKFTLAASKTLELQYYCTNGEATNGLGAASSSGETEIYGWIEFEKVA